MRAGERAKTPTNAMSIVEKPSPDVWSEASPAALVGVNLWLFDRSIFDACERAEPSLRGELELPSVVQDLIARGARDFFVVESRAPLLDLSSRSDIPEVAKRLPAGDLAQRLATVLGAEADP